MVVLSPFLEAFFIEFFMKALLNSTLKGMLLFAIAHNLILDAKPSKMLHHHPLSPVSRKQEQLN